jgi:autotransporter adhesin
MKANIGVGFFGGEQAIGFSFASRLANKAVISMGIGADTKGEHVGGNIGYDIEW